jgi:hypothetical protein
MTHCSRLAGFVAAVALLAPLGAEAQPLPLPLPPPPGVLFHAPPRLVDIEPGIQVVPDYEHEVFFANGRYYLREDGRWYRSRGHRWRWRHIDAASVPYGLRKLAQGHYRHWNPDRDRDDRPGRLHEADGPSVFFEGPPELIMSEEGFQVVPNSEHEVFFVDGRYYLRHQGHWYRSRGHRWRWRLIDFALVPHVLTNMRHPQGHYRHYRHDRHDTDRHDGDRHDRDRHDRDRDDRDRHDRDRDRHDGDRTDRDHGDRPGRLHEADRPPDPRLKNADDRRDRREDRRDDRMDRREDRRDDRKDNRKDRREDRKDDRKDRRDDRKDKRKDRRDD